MRHPTKWRETIDPYTLPYENFSLLEVIGYPHAGNDVFQARGIYRQKEVEVFIKVARQKGADIKREINTISAFDWDVLPEIIDYDQEKERFVVTLAKEGERLSFLVGNNEDLASVDYLYEYGKTLATLHKKEGQFPAVKDRAFFHIPPQERLGEQGLQFVYEYLVENQPAEISRCFCHGDFHYANILWKDKHISAILDFELSGIGNKEFDIAWALILRPGQKFMNTEEEISLFMKGYLSVGTCNWDYVKYYMVLIYSYFFGIGKDDPVYRNTIQKTLERLAARG